MTRTSEQSTGPSRLRLTPWAVVLRFAWLTAALWVALVPTFAGFNVREPLRHHVVIEQVLGLVVLSFPLGLVYGAIVLPLLFMALQEVFGIVIGNGASDVIIPLSFVAVGYLQWFVLLPSWRKRAKGPDNNQMQRASAAQAFDARR